MKSHQVGRLEMRWPRGYRCRKFYQGQSKGTIEMSKRPVAGRVPWVLGKGLVVKVGHMEFMLELGLPLALDIREGWSYMINGGFKAGLPVIARVCHGCLNVWMFVCTLSRGLSNVEGDIP